MAKTLTRAEAHQLIDDFFSDLAGVDGDLSGLLDLQQHWLGYRSDPQEDSELADMAAAECIASTLHEHVEAHASPQDDRTPRDDDPTDLTDPEEEVANHAGQSISASALARTLPVGSTMPQYEGEPGDGEERLRNAPQDNPLARTDPTPPPALSELTFELNEFCRAEGLPAGCAEELLLTTTLTQAHRDWLTDFVKRWDAAQAAEDTNPTEDSDRPSLVETIASYINSDDEDQSERLRALYEDADTVGKSLLDDAFICLCGYSLVTMLREVRK